MTEHAPHNYAEKLEQLQQLRREAAHAEGPAVEKQHAKGINSIVELPFGSGDDDVRFADRYDAGRHLAARLADIRGEDLVVVAIPRGGVAVAAEVARALGAPLDVVVVRKIGAPGKPEYAIGALAEGDVSVISDEAVRGVGLGAVDLDVVVARVRREHSSTGLLWRAAHDAKSLRCIAASSARP